MDVSFVFSSFLFFQCIIIIAFFEKLNHAYFMLCFQLLKNFADNLLDYVNLGVFLTVTFSILYH